MQKIATVDCIFRGSGLNAVLIAIGYIGYRYRYLISDDLARFVA